MQPSAGRQPLIKVQPARVVGGAASRWQASVGNGVVGVSEGELVGAALVGDHVAGWLVGTALGGGVGGGVGSCLRCPPVHLRVPCVLCDVVPSHWRLPVQEQPA